MFCVIVFQIHTVNRAHFITKYEQHSDWRNVSVSKDNLINQNDYSTYGKSIISTRNFSDKPFLWFQYTIKFCGCKCDAVIHYFTPKTKTLNQWIIMKVPWLNIIIIIISFWGVSGNNCSHANVVQDFMVFKFAGVPGHVVVSSDER